MARYSDLLGRRIEVHYRAGDILIPASGILVADSGRSVFLEQHLLQRGQQKHFRWEIPYQYIVRLEEKPDPEPPVGDPKPSAEQAGSLAEAPHRSSPRTGPVRNASAANASGGAPGLLPVPNRPKTA